MKILVITNLFPNKLDPTKGIYNKHMVDEMAKLCDLKVVAPVPWVPRGRIAKKFFPYGSIPKKEIIDSIEVFHPSQFIIPKFGRILYGLYFYISLYGAIKKIYASFKFDLILASWVFPDGVGSYYIAKKLKVPIVIEALGSDINIFTKFWLRRIIIRRVLSKCNKVIAVSNALKNAIACIGVPAEKVQVVVNGVDGGVFNRINKDQARKTLKLPVDVKIILFVGNLVPVKGIEHLIDAYKLVSSYDNNVRLILVGDGYLRPSLIKRAADYNVEVSFYGRAPHAEISLWMNACDVFCLPSENEGCPNVILEAMACGIRIVASRVGGIPEIVSSYGPIELVEPKNIKQLSKALIKAVTGNEKREETQNLTSIRSWRNAAQEILVECSKAQEGTANKTLKLLAITNLFPNNQEPTRGIFNKQQFSELEKLCNLKVIAPLPWFIKIGVPRKEIIEGIETYHPRYAMTPRFGRSLYGFFFYFSLLGYIKKLYKKFPFNAILATWAYPDAFGSCLIAKVLKKPIVIKVHGSDINTYSAYFLRRKMISWALRNSDRVIAVSNSLKEQLVKIGVSAEKIVVVPNGVDLNLFRPMNTEECRKKLKLPVNKKIILYAGNLVSIKGVDVLIDAFYELSRSHKDILLLLVGGGSMETLLRKKIKQFGIDRLVIFAGRQPHEKLNYYINACDVLCLPSRSEGCPNVILESIACARPIVATEVKGITELLHTDGMGLLVEPGNVESLAKALSKSLVIKRDCNVVTDKLLLHSWADNAKTLFRILQESVDK